MGEFIYNDLNKEKAERKAGKGYGRRFYNTYLVVYSLIFLGMGYPIAYLFPLLLRIDMEFPSFLIGSMITIFLIIPYYVTMRIMIRNYHYSLTKEDLKVYSDSIQFTVPSIVLGKDQIKSVIHDGRTFDENRDEILEKIGKHFFQIVHKVPIKDKEDFRQYFLKSNGVIILHDDPRDRLGIQFIDDRYHNDPSAIKRAILSMWYEKPYKYAEKIERPKRIKVVTEYDGKANIIAIAKVGSTLILEILVIISMIMFLWDSAPSNLFYIALGAVGIFTFYTLAIFMGVLLQRLGNYPGVEEYHIENGKIISKIPQMAYFIDIKDINGIRRLDDDFNYSIFKVLRYERRVWYIPRAGYKNPFIIRSKKGVQPFTQLGGAFPRDMVIIGDDSERTGYNKIKDKMREARKMGSRSK